MKASVRVRFLPIIALLVASSIMAAPCAAADPDPSSPEAAAILQTARGDIAHQLSGKQVQLQVKVLRTSGPWAFLKAVMREADGGPLNYQGTPFAVDAQHGAKSPAYAGLFRKAGSGAWQLVTSAVGPTDVAWLHWDREFGAPPELIAGVL